MKYAMEQLKEKLCRELDLIAEKRDISATDLDMSYKIMDVLKNIYKIDMYDSDGYSGEGEWTANGSYARERNSVGYGRNYRGTGYPRDYARDSSYSRNGGYSGGTIEDHLDAMIREARNDDERRMIEEMRRKLM